MERASTHLGADVKTVTELSGGGLSEVCKLTLSSGQTVVVKHAHLAAEEACMLRMIGATGCPAPEVIFSEAELLVMSHLPAGAAPDPAAWAQAGGAVARLHAARGNVFGWGRDHAFGALPIHNEAMDTWPDFWAERRLLDASSTLPASLASRLEALARDVTNRLPMHPPPALLHGDLWAGNLLFAPEGFSGLIDPACNYGDPEVDLAMLTLFARPDAAFFGAYGALDQGWEARRPIYQLWPALVHLRLFGDGYRPLVNGLLETCGV
ncbi:MAG: fructosamine kinase family protein [Pseudomonadota bacterium]